MVSIQVAGHGLRQGAGVPQRVVLRRPEPQPESPRAVYFGEPHGWVLTEVIARGELTRRRMGPLIVEEYDATCVIPPGAAAHCDASGNIVIDLG